MNNLDKPHKLDLHSASSAQINLDALYQIAPQCFTEVRNPKTGRVSHSVDFSILRQLLGDTVIEAPNYEAYQFTWVGKHDARAETARPTDKTLRPITADSLCWDTTRNLYIEGDNLEVLKLLQKSYLGKVKMIYIDPPYNTGNDFVYRDKFSVTKNEHDLDSGAKDEFGFRYIKNTNTNGQYHSDWCSMIYSRLMVARTLLSDDGVIFISIDDNEVHNLRKICDELFGEGNFVAQLIWERAYSPKNDAKFISNSHDYILMYAKNIDDFKIGRLQRTEEANARYTNPDNDPRGVWKPSDMSVKTYNAANDYPITTPSGRVVEPPAGRCWSLSKNAFLERLHDNRIWFGADGTSVPQIKRFLSELKFEGMAPTSILFYKEVGHSQEGAQEVVALFGDKGVFDGPKPVRLLERLLTLANLDEDSIVLDFFSGSATTAHALMKKNSENGNKCRFILVQLPEEISETKKDQGYTDIPSIAKERIRRAGAKIKSELQEQIEKAQKEVATTQAQLNAEQGKMLNDEVLKSLTEKLAQQQSELQSLQERYNNLDTGFRVLRLDSSNFQDVYLSPKEYEQGTLEFYEDNIKAERTDLDLLFGCMLSWGVQLSLPMQSEVVEGKTIYTVNEGDLVACFAHKVSPAVIEAMAEKQPLRVIFRDSCFQNDADKINIYETFKQKMDWSDQEVFKNIRVI